MLLSKSAVVLLFGIYLISDNYCFFLEPAEVTWKFVGSLPRPCQGSQQGVYCMETSEPRPGEKSSEAKAVHARLGGPFQRTSGSQPLSSSPSTTQIVNQDPGRYDDGTGRLQKGSRSLCSHGNRSKTCSWASKEPQARSP